MHKAPRVLIEDGLQAVQSNDPSTLESLRDFLGACEEELWERDSRAAVERRKQNGNYGK